MVSVMVWIIFTPKFLQSNAKHSLLRLHCGFRKKDMVLANSVCKNTYLSLAMALGTPCCLHAAGAAMAEEDLLNLSLEELLQLKITSSTLTDESLKTVPASITVFTQAQIQQLGVNTLEELMNYVPGYQSYGSDVGFVNYSSRSRRLSNSTCEVLVLLDGMRLDHDVFCGMSPTDGNFSLNDVEKIEFLRGPSSAIYGANAFLGVVNIVTIKNQNNLHINAGNHRQQRAAVNLSHQFDNGLQASLTAKSDSANSGKSRLFDPLTQDFSEGHQQQNNNESLYGQASWGDWSLQARHSSKLNEDGYGLGNLSDRFSQLDSYSNLFSINYAHSVNDHWKLKHRIYYTPYRVSFRGQVSVEPLLISNFIFSGSEMGVENHLSWQEGSSNALLGVDYSQFAIADAAVITGTPTSLLSRVESLDDRDRSIKAIYGQWQTAVSEQFSYIVGVRQDNYSDTESRTSPRGGLIFQCDSANTLKLLYGEAFRAPSRIELYIKNNPVQMGNPNLKPEIGKTAELVWMHTNYNHYLSVSLFDTRIKDPVALGNTPPPRPYSNVAEQHMSGMEIESKWVLNHSWQLDNAISHIFKSPLEINPDAEDLISTHLSYRIQKITLSLSGNYHGKSRDANNSTRGYRALGGFTLFNAQTQYQLTPDWMLYASIRNLSNKRYYQPAFQSSANVYGVPGTGREMAMGLRWNF